MSRAPKERRERRLNETTVIGLSPGCTGRESGSSIAPNGEDEP